MPDDAGHGYQEQRRTERVPAKLQVGFRELSEAEAEAFLGIEELPALPSAVAQRPAFQGHTENLSQGGMSLTGSLEGVAGHQLGKGRKLWLEFGLGDGGPAVRAMAVVAWSLEGRGEGAKFTAGLMFLGLSPQDLDRIGAYVEARRSG